MTDRHIISSNPVQRHGPTVCSDATLALLTNSRFYVKTIHAGQSDMLSEHCSQLLEYVISLTKIPNRVS